MKFDRAYKIVEIANLLQLEFVGDPQHIVSGLNEIHRVESGDLVFVDHPKYYDKALESNATTILIDKKVECPVGKALLLSPHPFHSYNALVNHFSPAVYSKVERAASAKIGKGSIVMPGVFVGENVEIGENCLIHPQVVLYNNTKIGNNVIIHSGTIIGADAFYYKRSAAGFEKFTSCGNVVIEDAVEIGALCTVDRGVSSSTIIGSGTKIDNHVQIGHDTVIGKNCLFASHVGIAGVVNIEDRVTLWGQVGVPSNVTIGAGAVLLGQTGIMKSVEGNTTYFGSPAMESRDKLKEIALVRRLPELTERVLELEKKLKELEKLDK